MFLKSIVIFVVAATVIAQKQTQQPQYEDSAYQVALGDEGFNPGPLLLHLRSRRQARSEDDRGSVGADVSRGPDGTRVRADVDYNIHTSRDGRTTVDANAGWERTYNGPQGHSRPDYNVGIGVRHQW